MLSRLKKLEAQSEQQANEVRSLRGENKRHQQDSDRQAKTINRLVKEIEQQTQKMNEILKKRRPSVRCARQATATDTNNAD